MPHKELSSSAALETSVALLREGIGPAASRSFALAPLWVSNVGCVGLIAIADIPYARNPPPAGGGGGRRRNRDGYYGRDDWNKNIDGHQRAGGVGRTGNFDEATAGRKRYARYAVGVGLVEFVRRVGVALGTATFRLRKQSLLAHIKMGGSKFSIYRRKHTDEDSVDKKHPRLASNRSPPTLSLSLADRHTGGDAVGRR